MSDGFVRTTKQIYQNINSNNISIGVINESLHVRSHAMPFFIHTSIHMYHMYVLRSLIVDGKCMHVDVWICVCVGPRSTSANQAINAAAHCCHRRDDHTASIAVYDIAGAQNLLLLLLLLLIMPLTAAIQTVPCGRACYTNNN